jgi:hypothetical protein
MTSAPARTRKRRVSKRAGRDEPPPTDQVRGSAIPRGGIRVKPDGQANSPQGRVWQLAKQGERLCAGQSSPLSLCLRVHPRCLVRQPWPSGGICPTASIIQDPATMTIIHPGSSMATQDPSALPHQVLSLCLLQQARRRPTGAPATATAMGLLTWHLLRLSPSRLDRPTVMSGLRTRHLLWLSPSRLDRLTVMSGLRTRHLLWLSPSRLDRPTVMSGLRTWHLLWLSPLRLGRSAASIVTGAMAFASIDEATEDSDGESWARPAASRLGAGHIR